MSKRENVQAIEYAFPECLLCLIRSLVSVELLFYGVRLILNSAFEHWVLSKEATIWIQIFLIATIVINEGITFWGRRHAIRIRVIGEILFISWISWRTWMIRDALRVSFHAWFDDYLPYWNTYYNTAYYPYGEGGKLGFALAYVVLSALLCMLVLRYVSGCRVFLFIPNVVAAGAALLVNVRPDTKSLLISFAGVLVLYSGGWEVRKVQIHSRLGRRKPAMKKAGWQMLAISAMAMVIAVIVFATPICFRSGAVRISNRGPEFLEFQHKAEDWLMSLPGIVTKSSYDKNKAVLDNDKPSYNDETIVTIHSNQLPQGNLYLKSFCSSTYKDGTWQPLDDSYAAEAEEQGLDSADLAAFLQEMTYEKMNQDFITDGLEMNSGVAEGTMRIDYENPKNYSALVPYLWNPSSGNINLRMKKDAVWLKGKESSVEFKQWMYPGTDMVEYGELYLDTGNEAYESSEEWYANYASEHDQNGTKDVPMVKTYANRVARALQDNTMQTLACSYRDDAAPSWDAGPNLCDRVKEDLTYGYTMYGPYAWSETDRGTRKFERYISNMARKTVAQEVRNQLFSDTEYNLYLDSLPAGTDPIEYFLGIGKEGYCMHYASAATLILQELGVPARYASGFVVKQDLFVREDGGTITKQDFLEKAKNRYAATVKDYYAHAWVEIYMDGIGWIPYEMTPGYTVADDSMPTDGKHDEELKQRHENHKKEAESQTESEQPSETTESSEQAAPKETQNSQVPSTQSIPQTKYHKNRMGRNVLAVAFMVLIGGLLVYAIYWLVGNYQKSLLRELQAKRNRNAVKKINRRMYRRLMKGRPMHTARIWRSGRFELHIRPLTDAEYADKLVKAYPSVTESDWMHYMEIVKKCAFSHEAITDEEAAFCYKIYETGRG